MGARMNDLISKIRYKIAELLNRNPSRCWAHLVCWALGTRKFSEGFDQTCKEGDYYCGKCEHLKEPEDE